MILLIQLKIKKWLKHCSAEKADAKIISKTRQKEQPAGAFRSSKNQLMENASNAEKMPSSGQCLGKGIEKEKFITLKNDSAKDAINCIDSVLLKIKETQEFAEGADLITIKLHCKKVIILEPMLLTFLHTQLLVRLSISSYFGCPK